MSENANVSRVRQYLAGEFIFQEGNPSDHFYILQKGEVEVSIKRQEKRFVVDRLKPGEFFGEMGLLSDAPRSACCKAATYVEVAQISNDDFKKILKNSHPLTEKIIKVLLGRLKKSNGRSISGSVSTNSFLAVATLLDLNFKANIGEPILIELFVKQVTSTFGILPHQAKEILQRFADFSWIRLEKKSRNNKKTFSSAQGEGEGLIYLLSSNFLEAARKIQDQPDVFSAELELMEIKEALELYEIDQKKFYSKMSAADFPDHLFLINKPIFFDLLKDKGKQFFEKPNAKSINDINNLDDLIFVDKKTIQSALQQLEAYDVAKLVKSASDDIAELFMGCFSARMKGIIDSTIDKINIDDDLEMQHLEKSFIDIIKRLKQAPPA